MRRLISRPRKTLAAALLLSGGGPISGLDASYVWWGKTRLFGVVPVMVIVFLGLELDVIAAVVIGGSDPWHLRLAGETRCSSPTTPAWRMQSSR